MKEAVQKEVAPAVRALLVEDDDEDEDIFRHYAAQLRNHAVIVERVSDEEGLRSRLSAERFDLIFMDLDLSRGESGLDLLKWLHTHKADIPVVVVTGSGDEQKAVEAMKSGAYDYLPKGNLSADLLERTIRNARQRYALEGERARMIAELEEMSVTDELTGVANRRHLTRRLEEETARSRRSGNAFALLMIDLDHFKQVNDRYGHQKGDDVLKQCAGTLVQNVRRIDFVARYGGEEFCVLLPDTSPEGARSAAERLREAVKALPGLVPTISIGVALWAPSSSAEEMLRRSDEALYKAKEHGRDRVVVYGE